MPLQIHSYITELGVCEWGGVNEVGTAYKKKNIYNNLRGKK